jgi:hypothetical protein
MADLTPAALRTIERQHAVITTSQLAQSGVGRRTRDRLVEAGVLRHRFKQVYVLAESAATLEQRCVELCLAHRATYLTSVTGGSLMHVRGMPPHAPLVLAAAHPLHIEHLGVRLRRTTDLRPSDVHRRRDGIRIASPLRLAFDLAADLDDRRHRSAVDQLIHEHGVTPSALAAIGLRLAHPRRRGSDRFLRTIAHLGAKPVESRPELDLADALRSRGVPIESQTSWLELPDGGRARIDLSVPDLRWGIEVDVHPAHLGIEGTTSDKRRDRQAHRIGWQIERVTSVDLLDLDALADELVRLYDHRRASFAA